MICNSGRQQTQSLLNISTENTLEYLAFGKGFVMDRIGDARNLNESLENNLQVEFFPRLPSVPWIFFSCLPQEIFGGNL